MQKVAFLLILFVLVATMGIHLSRTHAANGAAAPAQFNPDGSLVRPEGYRRWIYLSSGFGMSYDPNAGGNGAPAFTNVFVNPTSYDYYLANGKWPDKTMFVLEVYGSTNHGSIIKSGSYQQTFRGLDVEVKDEARFADKWAYFGFDGTEKSAQATSPARNDCWKCHEQNAAVEHSFVQFYPELLKVAKIKGTLKPTVHLE
jgi:hypothetical protein